MQTCSRLIQIRKLWIIRKCSKTIKQLFTKQDATSKICNKYNTWEHIKSGVPRGSILGSYLFNIFINDMFYVLEQSTLYNYADDNIVSHTSDEANDLMA